MPELPPHSMSPDERGLALEVLALAWHVLADADADADVHGPAGDRVLDAVTAAAGELPARHPEVSPEYATHLASAAGWYLDRAIRRIADPDRDGHTATQRAANLAWFAASATQLDFERLFAMAAALNADDV